MGGRSLASYLIGSIFGRISTDEHHHQREQEPLVSGVEKINMEEEDSIVYLALLPPTVAWISGRDPLLVVSVVMPGGFPQISFCLFLFLHHHDISIIASHIFGNKNYFFIKPYFILLKLSEKL